MTTLFLLHILLIGQVPRTLAFLSSLPQCAQSPSLGIFDTSSCASYSDTTTQLLCVCSDSGLLSDAAAAIYKQCGCEDLETTAQVVTQDCVSLGTSSTLSESDFIQAGCGSTTCGSSSSELSTGDIVGIVGGVIGGIALIVGFLQLAATLGWIDGRRAPWRYIQGLCCFCCSRGRTEDVGKENPQSNTSRDLLPGYQRVPHQDISSSYNSQWGIDMSTTIK